MGIKNSIRSFALSLDNETDTTAQVIYECGKYPGIDFEDSDYYSQLSSFNIRSNTDFNKQVLILLDTGLGYIELTRVDLTTEVKLIDLTQILGTLYLKYGDKLAVKIESTLPVEHILYLWGSFTEEKYVTDNMTINNNINNSGQSDNSNNGNNEMPILTSDLNLYVSLTGLDTNSGLTNSLPYLNANTAIKKATQYILNGYSVNINFADGDYSTQDDVILFNLIGAGKIILKGNNTNKDNVVLPPIKSNCVSGYELKDLRVKFTSEHGLDLINSDVILNNLSYENIVSSTNYANIRTEYSKVKLIGNQNFYGEYSDYLIFAQGKSLVDTLESTLIWHDTVNNYGGTPIAAFDSTVYSVFTNFTNIDTSYLYWLEGNGLIRETAIDSYITAADLV